MVRELEEIFGLDAIALHLRVARKALIFLEKLGGVAALPVVLAIAGSRIHVGRASTAAAPAAPAAALTIVDQTKILTKGGLTCLHSRPGPSRPSLHDPDGAIRRARLNRFRTKSPAKATKQSGVGDAGLALPRATSRHPCPPM
ncbi:hypothetical protein GCM10023232_23680 [Sphingosinicella ginsenosidimutans]